MTWCYCPNLTCLQQNNKNINFILSNWLLLGWMPAENADDHSDFQMALLWMSKCNTTVHHLRSLAPKCNIWKIQCWCPTLYCIWATFCKTRYPLLRCPVFYLPFQIMINASPSEHDKSSHIITAHRSTSFKQLPVPLTHPKKFAI